MIRTLGWPEDGFCFRIKVIVDDGANDRGDSDSTIRIGFGDRFIFGLVNRRSNAKFHLRTGEIIEIFENPVDEV